MSQRVTQIVVGVVYTATSLFNALLHNHPYGGAGSCCHAYNSSTQAGCDSSSRCDQENKSVHCCLHEHLNPNGTRQSLPDRSVREGKSHIHTHCLACRFAGQTSSAIDEAATFSLRRTDHVITSGSRSTISRYVNLPPVRGPPVSFL